MKFLLTISSILLTSIFTSDLTDNDFGLSFKQAYSNQQVQNHLNLIWYNQGKSNFFQDTEQLSGSLSRRIDIDSKVLNKTLSYRIYLPPADKIQGKLPVIYANDGGSYIYNGKMKMLLDDLISNNKIEPVAVVYLIPKDSETNKNIRNELFLCNPKFVDFFTTEFMPTIEKNYPISNKREDRTILGLSFGGLAAAYIASEAPESFKNIAMQSPAFHPCPKIYKAYKPKEKKDFKIYLSYGTGKDTETQSLPMVRILKRRKYELKVNRVVDGNHDWKLWKPELDDILLYFFSKK